jgi:hypothetical protein
MNSKTRGCKPGLWKLPMTIATVIACVLVISASAEAASTKVTDRETLITEKIPKPAHIWVYDFAATADDVPAESALADQPTGHTEPQTDEQIAEGRKLGAQIAEELAKQIHDMGLPGLQATATTKPEINDLVIRGYILSIKEGSEKERVGVGFGSGASELQTAVEGFEVTAQGLRKLGSGKVEAEGSKAPGAALGVVGLIATHNPLGLIVGTGIKLHGEKTGSSEVGGRATQTAKEIADELKKRFKEQGWID